VRNVGESRLPRQPAVAAIVALKRERNRVRLRVAKEEMVPPPLLL
jgi:hypothetical protein